MFGANKKITALKKKSSTPHDVYPQLPDQPEDKLSGDIARDGFIYKSTNEEHSQRRVFSIPQQQIVSILGDVYDVLHQPKSPPPPPTTKKKQPLVTSNFRLSFFPYTPDSKSAVDSWMANLAAGSPLQELIKQVPHFNKKEDILLTLFRNKVPIDRCCWYIKICSVLYIQQAESNRKKSNTKNHSHSLDWTMTILNFIDNIRETLLKTKRSGHPGKGQTKMPSLLPSDSQRLLHFLVNLMEYLYEERMLSRSSLLKWVIALTEQQINNVEVVCWRWSLCSKFFEEITHYVFLTRKLAMNVAHSITTVLQHYSDQRDSTRQFLQIPHCQNSRPLINSLVELICILTIRCPTAFVQYNLNVANNVFKFSPFDFLPNLPSDLPRDGENGNLSSIKNAESQILKRNSMCECRWRNYSKVSSFGQKIEWILSFLSKLNDISLQFSSNSFDQLLPLFNNDADFITGDSRAEAELVNFLFQWAVIDDEGTRERPLIAVQIILWRLKQIEKDNDESHRRQFVTNFQNSFFDFLDNCSVHDADLHDRSLPFTRLCSLVSELSHFDLLSVENYISFLITNGIIAIQYESFKDLKVSISLNDESLKDIKLSRENLEFNSQRDRHIINLKCLPFQSKITSFSAQDIELYLKSEKFSFVYGFGTQRDSVIDKFKEVVNKSLNLVVSKSFHHIKEVTYLSHHGAFLKLSSSLAQCYTTLKSLPVADRTYISGLVASKALGLMDTVCKGRPKLLPICVIEWILEIFDLSFAVTPLLYFCTNLVKSATRLYERYGSSVHCYVFAVFFSAISFLDKYRTYFFLNREIMSSFFCRVMSCINAKIISVSCFSHLVVIKEFIMITFNANRQILLNHELDYQTFCFDCSRIISSRLLDDFYYLSLDDAPSADSFWSANTSTLINPNVDMTTIQTIIANIFSTVAVSNDLARVYQISLHCVEVCIMNRTLQTEFRNCVKSFYDRGQNNVYSANYNNMNLGIETANGESLIVFITTMISRKCFSIEWLVDLLTKLIPQIPSNCKRVKRLHDINVFRGVINIFTFVFRCRSPQTGGTPLENVYSSLSCLYDRVYTHWSHVTVKQKSFFKFYFNCYGFFARIFSIAESSRSDTLQLKNNRPDATEEIWSWLSLITDQPWVKRMCVLESTDEEFVQRKDIMTNEEYIEMCRHMCFPGSHRFQPVDFCEKSVLVHVGDILDSVVVWSVSRKITILNHIFARKEFYGEIVTVILGRIFQAEKNSQDSESSTAALVHQILNSTDNSNWLIARLIDQIPEIQEKIIQESIKLLEDENFCVSPDLNDSAKQIEIFANLILNCLRVNQSLRDMVLKSLLSQFNRIVERSKMTCKSDKKYGNIVIATFHIRMQLLTKLFDYVIAQHSVNWMVVLSLLILRGVVTPESDVFIIVYDMLTSLAILIHGDDSVAITEFRKKIKPELNNSSEFCKKFIVALLPPEDEMFDQIRKCNSFGHKVDGKGRNISQLDPMTGLEVSDRIFLNPWEVIEGFKGSALCPSQISLRFSDGHTHKYVHDDHLLNYHTHNGSLSPSYYFQEIDVTNMEVLKEEQNNPLVHTIPQSAALIPQNRRFHHSYESVESPMVNKNLMYRYPVGNDFVPDNSFRRERMKFRPENLPPHAHSIYRQPISMEQYNIPRRSPSNFTHLISTYSNSPYRHIYEDPQRIPFTRMPKPPTANHYLPPQPPHMQQNPFYMYDHSVEPYNIEAPSIIPGDGYYRPPSVMPHDGYLPHKRMRGLPPESFRYHQNEMYQMGPLFRHPRSNTPERFSLNLPYKSKQPRNI